MKFSGARTMIMVGPAQEKRSGPPATQQQLETAWATSVTHSSGGSLSIQMGSKGFSDDMAKRWSEWFKTNLSTLAGGNRKAAGLGSTIPLWELQHGMEDSL